MIQSLVFDLGGVIMNHNIPGCIRKFESLMGDNIGVLGLKPNGEASAAPLSVMRDFELGFIHTDAFVAALLPYCRPGTTAADIIDAWVTMHAGIPEYRIALLKEWHLSHHQYALSNNNEAHWADLHHRHPDFDSWFDASFPSHLLHVSKPDVRIFELAEERIRQDYPAGEYRREDTIFIDDLEGNRLAARRFGWQACASVEELTDLLRQE